MTSRSAPECSRAILDEQALQWTVTTDGGEVISARFCIMATGALSAAITPDIPGLDSFAGESSTTPRTGRTRASTSPASVSP